MMLELRILGRDGIDGATEPPDGDDVIPAAGVFHDDS